MPPSKGLRPSRATSGHPTDEVASRPCLILGARSFPRDAVVMGAIVLVGTVLLVLGLIVATLVLVVGRSWSGARVTSVVAGLIVIVYGVSLIVVSLTTPVRSLAMGEWKCFDDWCASVTSLTRTGDSVLVSLSLQNRGRREQAPDSPHLWLVLHGVRDEVIVAGLSSRVPGGSVRQLPQIRLVSPASDNPQLVVTEGGLPSRLVIGDDNSPFHPQPGWQLT